MIKDLARKIFNSLGYAVSRKESGGFNAAYLSKICSPGTVFDVGVADVVFKKCAIAGEAE